MKRLAALALLLASTAAAQESETCTKLEPAWSRIEPTPGATATYESRPAPGIYLLWSRFPSGVQATGVGLTNPGIVCTAVGAESAGLGNYCTYQGLSVNTFKSPGENMKVEVCVSSSAPAAPEKKPEPPKAKVRT